MNNCGLVSISFRNHTAEEIIRAMQEANLTQIEWGSDVHVPETDLENAKRAGMLTKQAGITVSSYGTYYKLGQNQQIEPYFKAAKALNTNILRLWAGNLGSEKADTATRAAWVQEAKTVCRKAAEHQLKICFEYHPNTLTDTADSALQLMHEIDEPNCGLYWQPNYKLTCAENVQAYQKVLSFVEVLHIFYWDENYTRFPLSHGKDCLKAFFKVDATKPKLLEFVVDDDITTLKTEANTLFAILKEVF